MGGNGLCPLNRISKEGYMRESMYKLEIACPQWKIGDLKRKKEQLGVNNTTLF